MRLYSLLLALLAPLTDAAFNLTILHTNDMHGRIDEISRDGGPCSDSEECYGGFARIKRAVDAIKQFDKNAIFLNAGDNFQGGLLYSMFKANIIEKFIDMLGIDVMSLGNHEFDEGPERLGAYLSNVKTPTVAANIDYTFEPSFRSDNLLPWTNLTVGGVQIAVVGYIKPDAKFKPTPCKVKFMDEIPSIRMAARDARENGAKLVIALGHSGFRKDREIAEEVQEIDVVVGGDSHSFLYTGTPPDLEIPVADYPHLEIQQSEKKVPVVQAYAFTKYLGYLKLSFDDNFQLLTYSGGPILLNSSYNKDPTIDNALKPYKSQLLNANSQVIGETKADLELQCRFKECNFGNLLADALIYTAALLRTDRYWTMASIAIINGDNIQSSMKQIKKKGTITMGDLTSMIPYEESLFIVELTGEQLIEILEESVRHYSTLDSKWGSYLQFSGIRVVYDLTRPPMERVKEVMVRCRVCAVPTFEPVCRTRTYQVITTSSFGECGGSFKILKHIHPAKTMNRTLVEAFSLFVNKTSPVYPGEDNRIILLKGTDLNLHSSSPGQPSHSVPILIASISVSASFKKIFSITYWL